MGIFPNSPFVIAFFTAVFLRRIFVYYEFFAAGGAEPCFITCSAWGVASLIPPWLCALSAAEKSRACFSLVNYSFATFLADRVLLRCGFSFFFNSGTRSFYSCCRYFENFGYFCVTDTTVVQEHYNFHLILSHQTTSTVMYFIFWFLHKNKGCFCSTRKAYILTKQKFVCHLLICFY